MGRKRGYATDPGERWSEISSQVDLDPALWQFAELDTVMGFAIVHLGPSYGKR